MNQHTPATDTDPDATGVVDELLRRNRDYVTNTFTGYGPIAPALRTIVVGCVDPRVDPAHILGLNNNDAVVIRNVAGRITPTFFQQMFMLRLVAQADGDAPGPGWNFIVLHHTDCGITRLGDHPDLLAGYFGVTADHLDDQHPMDPYQAVLDDIETLRANPFFPAEFTVTGLVYDVHTGLTQLVAPPARLRPSAAPAELSAERG